MGEAVVPADNEYDAQVHLNFRDARVNSTASPEWMEVLIKASKTDPFRKGVTIYLGVTGGVVSSSSNVGLHGAKGGAGWSDVSIRRRQLPDQGTVRS